MGKRRVLRTNRKRHGRRGLPSYVKPITLTMDSGCAWHVHSCLDDLINVRPCEDTFAGVDNIVHGCSGMGDLPFACVDSAGNAHRLLLRNVRCVPSFKACVSAWGRTRRHLAVVRRFV